MMKHSEMIYHSNYMKIEFQKIVKQRFTKDFSVRLDSSPSPTSYFSKKRGSERLFFRGCNKL